MNSPEPWLKSRDASRSVLELLESARPPHALDEATRARSRRRVLALSGVSAFSALFWIQHVALGALLGGVGIAAVVLPRSAPSPVASTPPVSTTTRVSRPEVAAPRAELSPPTPSVEPPAPTAAPTTRVTPPTAPTEVASAAPASSLMASSLMEEAQLLERARKVLLADANAALLLLAEHERRFPNGTLRLEREFLAVSALARLQRTPEAEARATRLRALSHESLYDERLKQVLGGGGKTE
ncbi:MAG: hypothetical protein ACOY0T_38500 [Myxococcota bacterium]